MPPWGAPPPPGAYLVVLYLVVLHVLARLFIATVGPKMHEIVIFGLVYCPKFFQQVLYTLFWPNLGMTVDLVRAFWPQ